jgi:charged multivesicular body protein 3
MFGSSKPKVDNVKQTREWKMTIRGCIRTIEHQIRDLDREEKGVVQSIRDAAKRRDEKSVRILARGLVESRELKKRMFCGRAHLMAINSQLQVQIATMRAAGCIQESAEIMTKMNDLMRIPEFSNMMRELGREMEKSGLIQELMEDAMENIGEVDEEEVDKEVDKLMTELAIDFATKAPVAPQGALEKQKEKEKEKDDLLEARLMAL